jgi:hypothetical protein
VTNTADSGPNSLREAITDANGTANSGGPDTIVINTTGTVMLESDLPAISESVDITGPMFGTFTVDGNHLHRPFEVNSGTTVTMSDIRITHGLDTADPATVTPGRGGGIFNNGTLTLTRVVVTENAARTTSGIVASGGGIENSSTGVLHLVLSSVDNNEATAIGSTGQNGADGGGISNEGTVTLDRSIVDFNQALAQAGTGGTTNGFGGGISNSDSLTIRRSTISNNFAIAGQSTSFNGASGGGIANGNSASVDTLIDRSTIAKNAATATSNSGTPTNDTQGGGMLAMAGTFDIRSSTFAHNTGSGSSNLMVWGTLPIKNSIISDPEGASPVNCTSFGTISSQGFNMADDASCNLTQPTDQPSTDPKLDINLASNGGPTKTYALHTPDSTDPTPSPAIDRGHVSAVSESADQRGQARPSDFSSIANAPGGDGTDIGAFEVRETDPPDTIIDSGPSGITNDPTPTFAFHSTEPGSTFQCDSEGAYGFTSCTSPETTRRLVDGPHTFQVRARDAAGNQDPVPASRSFTVRTAEVKRSGSTLVVSAAPGATDNFVITRPSASTIRITDLPGGAFAGSGIHTGPGCTRGDDYTANCNAAGVTNLQVLSRTGTDRILNATAIPAVLNGGPGNDALTGGNGADTIIGGTGADNFKGRNGNDLLRARDLTSDTAINCDGGTVPGTMDKADLDLAPKDPNAIVAGCETKTRH